MTIAKNKDELLPHLFRQEFTKMTAVLCRHFGLKQIEIAEDIASETFLKASENWAVNGIPINPTAWLYAVAKNKVKDYFKHQAVVESQTMESVSSENTPFVQAFDFDHQTISDSQLAMIFAVCNPSNTHEGQICLALQILCGFSVEEIADAFLSKTETIKKRLLRARATLRNSKFQINELAKTEIKVRLSTVLKTLYLLFNEGYFSKTNSQLIRTELCSEAVRLCLLLTENALTNTPDTNALLALMCFQSSRLDARVDENGSIILYELQDKRHWDNSLIDKGNYYLVKACQSNQLSKYHLEAAIAYWHSTPTNENKWQYILQLYNHLIIIEYSPFTVLNRIFAFAKVYGNEKAIKEVKKLEPLENSIYNGLMGYLYSEVDVDEAIYYYKKAISLSKSTVETQTLTTIVEQMKPAISRYYYGPSIDVK